MDSIRAVKNLNYSNVRVYQVIGNYNEHKPGHTWIRVAIDYDVSGGFGMPNYTQYDTFSVNRLRRINNVNESWYNYQWK